MYASAKAQVRCFCTPDIEAIWLIKLSWITVSGSNQRTNKETIPIVV